MFRRHWREKYQLWLHFSLSHHEASSMLVTVPCTDRTFQEEIGTGKRVGSTKVCVKIWAYRSQITWTPDLDVPRTIQIKLDRGSSISNVEPFPTLSQHIQEVLAGDLWLLKTPGMEGGVAVVTFTKPGQTLVLTPSLILSSSLNLFLLFDFHPDTK